MTFVISEQRHLFAQLLRLDKLLELMPKEEPPMALPAPKHSFAVDRIHVVPPGVERPVLHDISFSLSSGDGLGIIGPSGAGKSSLARALVGVWPQSHGKIRLDNAALDQWAPEALGDPALASEGDAGLQDLRGAIMQLPDEYREPLVMQVLGGFSTAEIAAELGLTQAAVLTRLFRARNRLRARLQQNRPC